MITKITIENNKNTPFHYLSKVFQNGVSFSFKPDVNIIIGPNGCGKSTLLKLIYKFTFCESSNITKFKHNLLDLIDLFDFNKTDLLDGCKIKSDYKLSLFRLRVKSDLKQQEEQEDFQSFSLYINSNHVSVGEQTMVALNSLFRIMFESPNVDLKFPIETLNKYKEIYSDSDDLLWKSRFENLLNYYKRNQISLDLLKDKNYQRFTILMDEPDRNLDIYNIKEIYNILKNPRKDTQIICVLHNPVLIYKLSKCDFVNFVELEDGYLDKIKNFVEK